MSAHCCLRLGCVIAAGSRFNCHLGSGLVRALGSGIDSEVNDRVLVSVAQRMIDVPTRCSFTSAEDNCVVLGIVLLG